MKGWEKNPTKDMKRCNNQILGRAVRTSGNEGVISKELAKEKSPA